MWKTFCLPSAAGVPLSLRKEEGLIVNGGSSREPGENAILEEMMPERVNLEVPFQEKDEAKSRGAQWDPDARIWFAPKGFDLRLFYRWLPEELQENLEPLTAEEAGDEGWGWIYGAPSSPAAETGESQWDGRLVHVIPITDTAFNGDLKSFLEAAGLRTFPWPGLLELHDYRGAIDRTVLERMFPPAVPLVIPLLPEEVFQIREDLILTEQTRRQVALPPSLQAPKYQPRADILFYAGLALGAVPGRTVIVRLGRAVPRLELLYREAVHLSNTIKRRRMLLKRLESLGCEIQWNSNWADIGDFGGE